jgi:hypothetical protein
VTAGTSLVCPPGSGEKLDEGNERISRSLLRNHRSNVCGEGLEKVTEIVKNSKRVELGEVEEDSVFASLSDGTWNGCLFRLDRLVGFGGFSPCERAFLI